MSAFAVLPTLSVQFLLLLALQMLIITTVVRGVIACNYWFLWRSWKSGIGYVLLAHAIALFAFAAMTDFVDARSASSDGWLHSAAVLWPLQMLLLALDLAIRALRARSKTS